MRLASTNRTVAGDDPATETICLSQRHASLLAKMSYELNPAMPKEFGWPHAIRTILDRVEASGIDLTAASSENEVAQLALEAEDLRAELRELTVRRG
jgi:hypothetical protein